MLAFLDYAFYAGSLVAAATAFYQTRSSLKGASLPSKTPAPSTFISASTASIHQLKATVVPTMPPPVQEKLTSILTQSTHLLQQFSAKKNTPLQWLDLLSQVHQLTTVFLPNLLDTYQNTRPVQPPAPPATLLQQASSLVPTQHQLQTHIASLLPTALQSVVAPPVPPEDPLMTNVLTQLSAISTHFDRIQQLINSDHTTALNQQQNMLDQYLQITAQASQLPPSSKPKKQ